MKFLLIDAVWTGTSRADCLPETVGRQVGACWPFIAAKFAQFMYGFYPASEQLAGQSDLRARRVLLVAAADSRVPLKALNAILFFGVFPVVAFFLLVGGSVRPAARGDPAVGRAAGDAGDLVHRHHRLAAARHPAGARPPLRAADRPHALRHLHRVLARRAADHGAVLRDLHAAVLPAGQLEDRRAAARADRRRAVRRRLYGRGGARRPAGDPARPVRGRDGARPGLLAHDGFRHPAAGAASS